MKHNLTLKYRTLSQRQRGLTLAEIVVVIALIGILSGVLFSGIAGSFSSNKENITGEAIRNISMKIFEYNLNIKTRGKYPKNLSELDGIDTKDPFGNEYIYSTSSNCGKPYEIISMGKDGKRGTDDDISSCDIKGP